MRQTWKFSFPEDRCVSGLGCIAPRQSNASFSMPIDSEVIHVGIQDDGRICLWAIVESKNDEIMRSFLKISTGAEIPEYAKRHIGTVQQNGFVWHIFEV